LANSGIFLLKLNRSRRNVEKRRPMSQLPATTERFQLGVHGRPSPTIKSASSLGVLLLLLLASLYPTKLRGAEEGVALAIIYDTSGSMKDPVPDAAGGSSPKYVIANRALLAVTRQLQTFATNSGPAGPRKLQVGLFTFEREQAREVIPLAVFQPGAFESWANRFSHPHGNTPLGNTL